MTGAEHAPHHVARERHRHSRAIVHKLLRECARTQIRLPAHLAALVAREVADALDYAHHALAPDGRPLGLVHRDVSPGNILVSRRGDVKLTDFGIARAIERQHKTDAGTLKGKYGYMAPEQVAGGDVDPRVDVFAVGVVLSEMVMARRLFVAPNDLDVLLMVRDARLDRLQKYAAEFPVELRVLTVRALQRQPQDRWRSAAALRPVSAERSRRRFECLTRTAARVSSNNSNRSTSAGSTRADVAVLSGEHGSRAPGGKEQSARAQGTPTA